jgi:hypothetical protein
VGLIQNIRTDAVSPQFHVIYDQKFDTMVGGIMERRAQDITKDELQLFLKGRWDTSDRENSLEDWDTQTDDPLPKTPPEYKDHSIDG